MRSFLHTQVTVIPIIYKKKIQNARSSFSDLDLKPSIDIFKCNKMVLIQKHSIYYLFVRLYQNSIHINLQLKYFVSVLFEKFSFSEKVFNKIIRNRKDLTSTTNS